MTRLTVAAKTDIGRVRETNEDALLFADLAAGVPEKRAGLARFEVGSRGAILAVSDGMGGHQAGEVASAMTIESVYRALVERAPGRGTTERIKEAVEHANEQVRAAGKRPSLHDMGATVTAILLVDGEAHIAEVGDSRAYLLRGGELRQVTEDQSFVQVMVNATGMSAEDANASPMRNMLLQSIGHTPNLKVALGTLALRSRDLLILCSDGLTSQVTDVEIRNAILAAQTLASACDRLVALANERGGTDNVTVLLAGVSGDVPAPAPGERISDTFSTTARYDLSSIHGGHGSS